MRSDLFPLKVKFFGPRRLRKAAHKNKLREILIKKIFKCSQIVHRKINSAFSQWMLAFKKFILSILFLNVTSFLLLIFT